MNDERFDMRMPRELLARVDEWRQRQTVPPTRAAAMRYLIEQGISGHAIMQTLHDNAVARGEFTDKNT